MLWACVSSGARSDVQGPARALSDSEPGPYRDSESPGLAKARLGLSPGLEESPGFQEAGA